MHHNLITQPYNTPTKCYLMFDERMTLHVPPPGSNFPIEDTDAGPFERSSRITSIYNHLLRVEDSLLKQHNKIMKPSRFVKLSPTACPRSTVLLAHTSGYYDSLLRTASMSDAELKRLSEQDSDLYFCRDTFLAATLAAGGVVDCCDKVLSGVGPTRIVYTLNTHPGHHAANDAFGGYCYLNTAGFAARKMQEAGYNRVCILSN